MPASASICPSTGPAGSSPSLCVAAVDVVVDGGGAPVRISTPHWSPVKWSSQTQEYEVGWEPELTHCPCTQPHMLGLW